MLVNIAGALLVWFIAGIGACTYWLFTTDSIWVGVAGVVIVLLSSIYVGTVFALSKLWSDTDEEEPE